MKAEIEWNGMEWADGMKRRLKELVKQCTGLPSPTRHLLLRARVRHFPSRLPITPTWTASGAAALFTIRQHECHSQSLLSGC